MYFLYARVSTERQEQKALSIPDQVSQMRAYVASRDGEVLEVFSEAGTGTDETKRPAFQDMIERACQGSEADTILVHSFSRFYRDAIQGELTMRRLAKHGVRVESVTQPTGNSDDPAAEMVRRIVGIFDEYQSKETAKHTLRSMKENARQGHWNGSSPPLGFQLEEVERRGTKIKRVLAIDEVEAETIRLIFRTYLFGIDGSGAMGVKSLVVWLNRNGYRTRSGALFSVGVVHRILVNEVYVGTARFNVRCAKTGATKPEAEHVKFPVPAIVDRQTFDEVSCTLTARNPKTVAPRVTTSPILLGGLAVHATCGSAMTLRTGTSRSGRQYRYYTCSGCARKGDLACTGLSLPLKKLDDAVTSAVSQKVLEPVRLSDLLSSIAEKRQADALSVTARIQSLQLDVTDTDARLKKLYALVEGDAEIDEVLKARLLELRDKRDKAKAAIDRARTSMTGDVHIEPEQVEKFGRAMKSLICGGAIKGRKAFLRSVVDRIEVDRDIIKIIGRKDRLESLIKKGDPRAACSQLNTEWRPGRTPC